MQKETNIQYKQNLVPPLLVYQFSNIYKTGKEILIYKKYMCNLGQSNFNLLADYIYTKIITVLAIDINFFEHQYNVVV